LIKNAHLNLTQIVNNISLNAQIVLYQRKKNILRFVHPVHLNVT
jgi:hypothetical protein